MRAASIIDTTRTLIYRCAKLLRIFYNTKLFVRFLTHGRRDSVYLDNFLAFFRDLSINGAFVHTSLRRIQDFSWNRKKIAVTLHCPNENKQNGQGDFADSVVQMFQNVFGVRV